MTDHDAFAHHIDKLTAAHPEHAVVRLFLPSGRRDAVSAFEAVVYELEQTLWRAREPQAAAVKLQWWAEELARTLGGEARHPLTQALPSSAPTAALQHLPRQWLTTALNLLDDGNAADFAAQLATAESFYAPLAQIESVLLGAGADAAPSRALSLLLRELGRMAMGQQPHRLAVPLQLLARHQLTRESLEKDSEARERLLHDQLEALAQAHEVLPRPVAAGLPVRLRLRLERRLVNRLARQASPTQGLRAAAVGVPLMTAWHAWREARQMH
jgi:phytoene synthase